MDCFGTRQRPITFPTTQVAYNEFSSNNKDNSNVAETQQHLTGLLIDPNRKTTAGKLVDNLIDLRRIKQRLTEGNTHLNATDINKCLDDIERCSTELHISSIDVLHLTENSGCFHVAIPEEFGTFLRELEQQGLLTDVHSFNQLFLSKNNIKITIAPKQKYEEEKDPRVEVFNCSDEHKRATSNNTASVHHLRQIAKVGNTKVYCSGGFNRDLFSVEHGGEQKPWNEKLEHIKSEIAPTLNFIKNHLGITAVVSLVADSQDRDEPEKAVLEARKIEFIPCHVPDFQSPDIGQIRKVMSKISEMSKDGGNVLIHCGSGIGRSGKMGAAVLVLLGCTPSQAKTLISAGHPLNKNKSIESADITGEGHDAYDNFDTRLDEWAEIVKNEQLVQK